MENIEILRKIINEIKQANSQKLIDHLIPEMNLRDDLGFDSLDLAELTVKIEDEIGVDIFENGLVNTIGQLLNKLEEK